MDTNDYFKEMLEEIGGHQIGNHKVSDVKLSSPLRPQAKDLFVRGLNARLRLDNPELYGLVVNNYVRANFPMSHLMITTNSQLTLEQQYTRLEMVYLGQFRYKELPDEIQYSVNDYIDNWGYGRKLILSPQTFGGWIFSWAFGERILQFPSNVYKSHVPFHPQYVKNLDGYKGINTSISFLAKETADSLINQDLDLINGLGPKADTIKRAEVKLSDATKMLLKNRYDLNILKIMMARVRARGDKTWKYIKCEGDNVDTITYNGMFVCFDCKINGAVHSYLLDYDDFLMIVDNISMRAMTCLAIDVYESIERKSNLGLCPTIKKCRELWDPIDNILKICGNQTFKLIKRHESLTVGYLVSVVDKLSSARNFYQEMKEDFYKDLYEIANGSRHRNRIVDQGNKYIKCIESIKNPYVLGEVYGFHRFWGHPTVNSISGCLKVQRIVRRKKNVNINTMSEVTGILKKAYVDAHINKTGYWPDVKKDSNNPKLAEMLNRRDPRAGTYRPGILLSDWGDVKFEKNLHLKVDDDYTTFVEDRAISVERHEIPLVYNRKMTGISGKVKSKRRVLLSMLESYTIDIQGFLEKLDREGIPLEHLVVGVHEKEREVNMDPRLFAMLTMMMRFYFSVTEKAIMDDMFPHFPQQTMNKSEKQVQLRLLKISTPELNNYITIKLHIDFEKWNLHFCEMSTNPVFGWLDDLYGFNQLFSLTHKFFKESIIYLSNNYQPDPTLLDNLETVDKIMNRSDTTNEELRKIWGDTIWLEHDRGFEGQRQKGWTLITIGLIMLVSYRTGIPSILTGQGDNQVPTLFIEKPRKELSVRKNLIHCGDIITGKVDAYLDLLKKLAGDIGLTVKKEESWYSSAVTCYGKVIYMNGSYLGMSLKPLARLQPEINDLLPTLENQVSTIGTAVQMSAAKGTIPLTSLYIGYHETAYTIASECLSSFLFEKTYVNDHTDMLFSKNPDTRKNYMIFNVRLPNIVNGWATSNLSDLLCKGHPDHLTSALTMIKLYGEYGEDKAIMSQLYSTLVSRRRQLYSDDLLPDYSFLMQDPESVNWRYRFKSAGAMKEAVTDLLRQPINKNKDIKDILQYIEKEKISSLSNYLMKTRPLYIRPLSDVFSRSPVGAAISFMGNFTNVRTLAKSISISGMNKLHGKIERDSEKHLNWISSLYKKCLLVNTIKSEDVQYLCPTELAQCLRDESWRLDKDNNRMEGITVPLALHQFSFSTRTCGTEYLCCGEDDEKEYIYFKLLGHHKSRVKDRGPIEPYLGSATSTGMTQAKLKINNKTSTTHDSLVLQKVKVWACGIDGQLARYLDLLTSYRTDLKPGILEWLQGDPIRKCVIHRYNDPKVSSSSSYGLSINFPGHVYISSDNCGKYSRSQENYNIYFNGTMVSLPGLLHLSELAGFIKYNESIEIHGHINCPCCSRPVVEELMENFTEYPCLGEKSKSPIIYSESDISVPDFSQLSSKLYKVRPASTIPSENDVLWSAVLGMCNPSVKMDSVSYMDYKDMHIKENPLPLSLVSKLPVLDLGRQIIKLLTIITYPHLSAKELAGPEIMCAHYIYDMASSAWDMLVSSLMLPENRAKIACLSDKSHTTINKVVSKNTKAISIALILASISSYNDWITDPSNLLVTSLIPSGYMSGTLSLYYSYVSIIMHCNAVTGSNLSPISYHSFRENDAGDEYKKDLLLSALIRVPSTYLLKTLKENDFYTLLVDPVYTAVRHSSYQESLLEGIRGKAHTDDLSRLMQYDTNVLPKPNALPPSIVVPKDGIFSIPEPYTESTIFSWPSDQIYRFAGRVSTTALKVVEILPHIVSSYYPDDVIVCLADGESGLGFALGEILQKDVVSITKKDIGEYPYHRGLNYQPGGAYYSTRTWKHSNMTLSSGGDLTSLETVAEISTIREHVTLLTMDAENIEIFKKGIDISLASAMDIILSDLSPDNCIFKTFLTCKSNVDKVCTLLHNHYVDVKIFRCLYSVAGSTEVYVMGSVYRTEGVKYPVSLDESGHNQLLYMMAYDILVPTRLQREYQHAHSIMDYMMKSGLYKPDYINHLGILTSDLLTVLGPLRITVNRLEDFKMKLISNYVRFVDNKNRFHNQELDKSSSAFYNMNRDSYQLKSERYLEAIFNIQLLLDSVRGRQLRLPSIHDYKVVLVTESYIWTYKMMYSEHEYYGRYGRAYSRLFGLMTLCDYDCGDYSPSMSKYKEMSEIPTLYKAPIQDYGESTPMRITTVTDRTINWSYIDTNLLSVEQLHQKRISDAREARAAKRAYDRRMDSKMLMRYGLE